MTTSTETLIAGVLTGQTKSLAKAITLLETSRADQRQLADQLLTALLPHSGRSLRIAISGPPGVGKSTFIEAFGEHLLKSGHRLAVLAIDPSSPVSGGSIMGDRLRMENLAKSSDAFIRPSPSSGMLGGTARRTRETIIACEAAGFDVICIETVGVGQSETLAASMTDLFILLSLPNSGDEVQGIKRGILELADFVVITKADGASKQAAELAKFQIEQALMLTRHDSKFPPQVSTVSSIQGRGIKELYNAVAETAAKLRLTDDFAKKRRNQAIAWFRSAFIEHVIADADRKLQTLAAAVLDDVAKGKIAPSIAAAKLAATIISK
ncbi:MAG: methylmalonyl Co-A mutase-associated GTPase MeaB [Deltaproteobacteria bacterium]|nr:methylmalonyl Co-A mutase-associated GTPase MeaB [Deltaproteobacteria bacterium]